MNTRDPREQETGPAGESAGADVGAAAGAGSTGSTGSTGPTASTSSRSATASERGTGPAPAVPEPSNPQAERDLAALMFKPPIQPGRRIGAAPDPTPHRPTPGTRPELPVVYGARAIPPPPVFSPSPGTTAGGTGRGHSAADARDAQAEARAAQRSLQRQNARFRRLARIGGAGVLVVVVTGLAALARLAASWL